MMYYNFCPTCGSPINQEQKPGQRLICGECGMVIGEVVASPKNVIDPTAKWVESGAAAPCPICQQVVEVKNSGGKRSFVPHFQKGTRRMCQNSGKPVG
ncbi:MAG: hypothetical protein KatS3mg105_0503 [Gemmatales bacterium]|nr:MAG: hypothetical protein KatS3mg105_0503 [Gemmatales bacterium]